MNQSSIIESGGEERKYDIKLRGVCLLINICIRVSIIKGKGIG